MITTFHLPSYSDDLNISVLEIVPDAQPKGILQIVHGMCEHKERYVAFMEFMAKAGYVCIIHDHRGHGESVKSADDLGYMYAGGWEAMVEEVRIVNEHVRGQYPALKCVLFGHSMGSMVVRSFAKRYDHCIDALFVCGSPSYNVAAGIAKVFAGVIERLKGDRCRPAIIQHLAFDSYNKPYANEGYTSAWVCSDRAVLEAYHNDPLCMYIFTANGFRNLFALMQDCYSQKGWQMRNAAMPVHFISGADDPCRISDKKLNEAVNKMRKAGYGNVDCLIFKDMRHEVLNETRKQEVWEYVLESVGNVN